MKNKIIFILLCFLSLNVMGQGITQGTITRNKCKTCGKVISQCPYKGKHPAKPTPKPTPTPNPKPTPTPKPTKPSSGTLNGHEWVDLGLSVKWATCNVGANSPSDYGGYYAWGETSTKSRYDWDNCFDCVKPSKWTEDSSWGTYKIDGQTRITPTSGHDTARENWGSTWRMPTEAELKELCNKCRWTWTSKNGQNGYTVTGPNGNSIFLPAAGWRDDTKILKYERGYYWSSTLSASYSFSARFLYFNSSRHNTDDGYGRSYGRSVRPVTE